MVDIATATTTDEQDLAKALDSVAETAANLGSHTGDSRIGLAIPDNPPAGASEGIQIVPSDSPAAPAPVPEPIANNSMPHDTPSSSGMGGSTFPVPTPPPADNNTASDPLDDIKRDALFELRPLVDKLDVKPEEKFDTYLLLIRSTDDVSLIAPAHEAAKAIPDEARRAEALLDVIKEIDYLSRKDKS